MQVLFVKPSTIVALHNNLHYVLVFINNRKIAALRLLQRAAAFGCNGEDLRAKQWGPLGPAKNDENPFRICFGNPFGQFCVNPIEFFVDIH